MATPPETAPAPAADSVDQLEHDHHHLTRVVTEMREAIRSALREETPVEELHVDALEFLTLVTEELYEHFNKEEEGLFPYLAAELPETAATVEGLERAHDRMCGVVGRMEHLVREGEESFVANFDLIVSLFTRFDAYFTRHARDEGDLLREARLKLNREQRRHVARLLAEL